MEHEREEFHEVRVGIVGTVADGETLNPGQVEYVKAPTAELLVGRGLAVRTGKKIIAKEDAGLVRIRALSGVVCDGHNLEVGQEHDATPAAVRALISRGLAELVE